MLVDDIILPRDISAQVKDVIQQLIDIVNGGLYQQKIYTGVPSAGDPGFEGETRIIVTGATMTLCKYASGYWWKSDNTTASGFSKIT